MITQRERKMPTLPKPSSFEPVPAGTYKVRVVNYEHGHSSVKGTPQIKWKAEIIEPEDFKGKFLWDRTIMVDSSVWRVANLLGACGLDFKEGIDTDSDFFNQLCQASLGRTTFWLVDEKTLDSGTMVNEIKGYNNDRDQEMLEVTPTDDTPGWIEEEQQPKETKKKGK